SLDAYVDPRELRSSPTRRSSDLHVTPLSVETSHCRSGATGAFETNSATKVTFSPVRATASSGCVRNVNSFRNCDGANATLLMRTDRKSTRLNSSHVKISYAVFCL